MEGKGSSTVAREMIGEGGYIVSQNFVWSSGGLWVFWAGSRLTPPKMRRREKKASRRRTAGFERGPTCWNRCPDVKAFTSSTAAAAATNRDETTGRDWERWTAKPKGRANHERQIGAFLLALIMNFASHCGGSANVCSHKSPTVVRRRLRLPSQILQNSGRDLSFG